MEDKHNVVSNTLLKTRSEEHFALIKEEMNNLLAYFESQKVSVLTTLSSLEGSMDDVKGVFAS